MEKSLFDSYKELKDKSDEIEELKRKNA